MMKIPKIASAIGQIDPDLIDAAAKSGRITHKKPWLRWGTVAASLALLVIGGGLLLPSILPESKPSPSIIVKADELGIIFPWDYKTDSERYPTVEFGGRSYSVKSHRGIDQDSLGDLLGSCEATGKDIYTDRIYTETFEVHKIRGVSEERMIAVGGDGGYEVYMIDPFDPGFIPATLGELFDLYGIPDNLELSAFTRKKDERGDGTPYTLGDDAPILGLLSACRDAAPAESVDFSDLWNRKGINFTVSSRPLGAYNNVLRVSEDGYLSTNILSVGLVYFIGRDSAAEIIERAEELGQRVDSPEPYQSTIAGRITEIGDGYLLVDNRIIAPAGEEKVYRIEINCLQIRRCIEFLGYSVGDIVVVTCGSEPPADGLIDDALSIARGELVQGSVASNE